MSEDCPPSSAQPTPFQRFTVRLVDGKFVRVPRLDLPSVEAARQTIRSNPPEVCDVFHLVDGCFQRIAGLDPLNAPAAAAPSTPALCPIPEPTFDLPADTRLPATG